MHKINILINQILLNTTFCFIQITHVPIITRLLGMLCRTSSFHCLKRKRFSQCLKNCDINMELIAGIVFSFFFYIYIYNMKEEQYH